MTDRIPHVHPEGKPEMTTAAKIHLQRRRMCDFCGKGEEAVRVLIVSPGEAADICDECVGVCVEVIADYERRKAGPPQESTEQTR